MEPQTANGSKILENLSLFFITPWALMGTNI